MSIGSTTTFWKLISDKQIDSITIPQIQRDYVQGRDTEKINYFREKLLDEIKKGVETGENIDLNFVYGKEDGNVFIPIDGQQRLTTLFALHLYAFGYADNKTNLSLLKAKFKYETRITTKRFIEKVTDNISTYFIEKKYSSIKNYIEDAAWYSDLWERDPSVKSFLIVLDDIDKKFSSINNLADILISNDCPLRFMNLQIDNVGRINDLYIKMNSRGKPLTDFENFKSSLFEHLEQKRYSNTDQFKSNMDNVWLSYIWENTDKPEKNCDQRFMTLLDIIIKNRLLAFSDRYIVDDSWNRIFSNKQFYNFDYYSKFIDNLIINDIEKTFDFLIFYTDFASASNNSPSWLKDLLLSDFNPGHKEKVRLAAITKYAISVNKQDWDKTKFNSWYRVVDNLVKNTSIDVEKLTRNALNSIYNMSKNFCLNPYDEFSQNIMSVPFFNERQREEEQLKCKLIIGNNNWEDLIKQAESNDYFEGEINFAFKLCNIFDDSNINLQNAKLQEFTDKWNLLIYIFNSDRNNENVIGQNNLFRRALLTFGDYKIDTNSSFTYCFEGKKNYYNWRRLLRDSTSFNIFRTLFEAVYNSGVHSPQNVVNSLEGFVTNYSNMSNPFLYYLIKLPKVFAYMNEKRIRHDTTNNRIILYSGATLQAEYAEAYTYFAFIKYGANAQYKFGQGQLLSENTKAYISQVNGTNCHIEYCTNNNCFCDENGNDIVDANRNNVTTVEDLVNYMRNEF